MDKELKIANAKLIYEFLGKEYIHHTFENRTSWISARKNLKSRVYKSFDSYKDLKYHKSWDWLMSVVDKIELMGYNVSIASYHPNKKLHWCDISKTINDQTNESISIVTPIESNKKIKCVYLACIEFIHYIKKSSVV